MTAADFFAAALASWNLVALLTVVFDKRTAVHNGEKGVGHRRRRRVPERQFLIYAVTLGGAGVLVGFYSARHKTLHRGLLAGVWCLTLLSYAACALLWVFVF